MFEQLVHLPILGLVAGWISYVLYVLHQNKKMRKDLQMRDILNEINSSQRDAGDLNLHDLVRLANESKVRRTQERSSSQKK